MSGGPSEPQPALVSQLEQDHNPFATRFVKPGQLAWLPPTPDQSLEQLVAKFAQLKCRAAIVGPHGSGKSTLIEHLVPRLGAVCFRATAYQFADTPSALEDAIQLAKVEIASSPSCPVIWLALRGSSASKQLLFRTEPLWAVAERLLVIDGYEQLPWRARGWLQLHVRRSSTAILVTSHRRTILPTLLRTCVASDMLAQLIEQLLPTRFRQRQAYLDRTRIDDLLKKHHGNVREAFMDLYDQVADQQASP